MFTLSDFQPGDRVELAPHLYLWMRGARFGTVTKVGRVRVTVRVDKLGREMSFKASDRGTFPLSPLGVKDDPN